MSLKGTWLLNPTLTLPTETHSYALNFEFFFSSYMETSTSFSFSTYSSRMRLTYGAYVIYAYNYGAYKYTYQDCRYITVTGGDDVENADLIAWFADNAQRVDTPNYQVRYIELLLSAEAIRGKSSSVSAMKWKDGTGFQDAVNSIALGTDTSNGTANGSDIKQGKVAYSQGAEIVGTLANANGVSF